ncbi:keratin, type I cytoskeletal 9-like [Littorina saxatilis]|uniref:keratin, type I cytoskeletal 9-like n=1 Tax=Littorina saxatilis TaxID=31220 RepID=UPI0038B68980
MKLTKEKEQDNEDEAIDDNEKEEEENDDDDDNDDDEEEEEKEQEENDDDYDDDDHHDNDQQQKSFDIVAQRFDTHFTPKRNLIHERALFHQRSQQQGETIEEYVRDLFKLAEFTEFPDRDNTIRDRVVLGVTDQNLSQKLQLEPDLDLDKAVTMARQHEQVKAQMAEQRGVSSNVDEVNKSSVGGSSFQRGRGRNHGHRGGAQGFSGHRGSSSSHRGSSSSHRGGSSSQRGGSTSQRGGRVRPTFVLQVW